MRRNMTLAAMLAAAAAGIPAAESRAIIMEVSSTFSGGLYADGTNFSHFMNYYVGYAFPSSPPERRNYFIFDLSHVPGPILGGKLKLYLPGDSSIFEPSGFVSSDPTEEYRISGSAFPWEAFSDAFMGEPHMTPGVIAAMFGTMGSGPAYGLTVVSGDHSGSDVVIDLSTHAVDAMNAAIGSKFLITGRLTDLHPESPGMPPAELVFAYTDIPNEFMPMPRLMLHVVPSPGVASAVGIAGVLFTARRRRS
ncbi:MAG: hypothetical protein KF787_13475 [Phycisphaeraceae bacterium]|nr:hypothetical protein [Phycisphaerae bacterium]MBX3393645.1 hypothetical protein [Phycisphaeraceae bacterium]